MASSFLFFLMLGADEWQLSQTTMAACTAKQQQDCKVDLLQQTWGERPAACASRSSETQLGQQHQTMYQQECHSHWKLQRQAALKYSQVSAGAADRAAGYSVTC